MKAGVGALLPRSETFVGLTAPAVAQYVLKQTSHFSVRLLIMRDSWSSQSVVCSCEWSLD